MFRNPALEDQACDRIYRVGQRNNVTIHRLCFDKHFIQLSVARDEGQATLSLHAPLVLWGSNPLTPGLEGYPGEIGCPTLVIEDVLALSV